MKKYIIVVLLLIPLLLSSCTTTYPGYTVVQNTSGQELKLNGDGELVTEDRVHHEIHEGDGYHMEDSYELAINGVLDIQFITGADYIHLVDLYTMESETSHYLYEGATISVNGTAANIQNKNRITTNTSSVTAYYQINTSLANANAERDILSCIVRPCFLLPFILLLCSISC